MAARTFFCLVAVVNAVFIGLAIAYLSEGRLPALIQGVWIANLLLHSPLFIYSGKKALLPANACAEIEALRKNSERYRWLRDHWHDLCTATGIDTHGNYCVTEVFVGAGEHAPFADGTLDAAIDAAMREQGANA